MIQFDSTFISLGSKSQSCFSACESESHSVVSDSLRPHGLYSPRNSSGQNTGVGSLSLLQGIFSTQGSNPSLPHCKQILYQLSHKGSPRIMELADYPFSSESSWARNQTRVSCIAGGFFTSWATREAQGYWSGQTIPSPVNLPDPGIKPGSPALQADSLPAELLYGLINCFKYHLLKKVIISPFQLPWHMCPKSTEFMYIQVYC